MKMLTKKLIISWSVCLLLIIIYIPGSSGQCTTAGRFGSRLGAICKHECHCAPESAECDKNTGACTSCASGYHGSTCQKENVALGRHAFQSTTLPKIGNAANFAVNGDTSTTYSVGDQCTHTNKQQNAWWYVDLVNEYNITTLRVYNRKSSLDRLRGFTVRIGSDPQRNTLPICYQHPDTTPAEVINVACDSTMRGRYLLISLETRVGLLTLCEVQVFVCTDHSFGAECNKICYCKSETDVCDKVTGYCTSGCAAGYMGVDCQKECPMNTYGDCMTNCSAHCKPVTSGTRRCNFISGHCTNTIGCQAGYMGLKCTQECPMDTYGDCNASCSTHCLVVDGWKSKCNHITGHCTDGCQPGYNGAKCDQACMGGFFGSKCAKRCNCKTATEVCVNTNGACSSGCAAGFQSEDCQTECDDDRFGENCHETCNCGAHSTGCDKATGRCFAVCPAGFQGENCKTDCADRLFGMGCAKRCNCIDETEACNKRTGACSSGCAAEFEGQDCKTVAAQERPVDGVKITAIVIGGLLGLALIATLFVIYKQRRRLHVYSKATQTKASLVGQVGKPTYHDLVHNIDTNDAEQSVASPADIVIEYEMEGNEYDEIPQMTTNERQHQRIAK